MEKELVFQILGINELNDERIIKTAYMQKLKETNPEDDPEGFRRLREAYEKAIELLHSEGEEEEEKEKTEFDRWIDRMDGVYQNFKTRGDVEAWKELLSDELCENLDTSLDARNAAIQYLLSHFYLPMEIWQCLDREFDLVADYEQLKERFPADFLDYVKYYTENPYWVKFDRFERRENASGMNVDAYIRTYLDMKNMCDNQDFENAAAKFEELSAYGVWYPLEDVEKMRLLEAKGKREEALKLAERLSAECEDENSVFAADKGYILPVCGNVKWNAGDKQGAFELWNKAPEHIDSKFGRMKYYLESEDTAEEAKEIAMDIWEQDGSNQRIEQYVTRANELILGKYERQIAEAQTQEEKNKIGVEMAWCYFQNQNSEKALEILDGINPGENCYYSYHNLKGRALAAAGKIPEAIPELQKWLSLILETVDDGSEESKKRLRRKGTAYLMLGHCLMKEKRYDEAIEMLKRAEQENTELSERLSAMNIMAETYVAMERYELATDKCDEIIKIEPRYYPAYLFRQEAGFKMRRAQQVVDDYYRAIEIYPAFYKPYLLAAKVFFIYRQYQDAKGVIDRAKEAQVQFSDELKLLEAKILRNLAENSGEREPVYDILDDLQEHMNPEQTDLEDISEVDYEQALILWDDNDLMKARMYLEKAIKKNPQRLQYYMVKGDLLRELRKFDEALKAYQTATEDYDETAGYYYGVGCCYSGMGYQEKMVAAFKKALSIDPKYRGLNERIAEFYMDKYREDSDRAHFIKAVEYINKEVEIDERCYSLVCRGLIYMDGMMLEEAIADFEKALTYQPDDWASYNNLGCCYKYMGQYDKAIASFNKAAENTERNGNPRVLPYSNLADVYEMTRQFHQAIECYKKGLTIDPGRIQFYKEIGNLYFSLKDYGNAIHYYTIWGEKNGGKKHLIEIGECYAALGDFKKARSYYENVISEKARMMTASGNGKNVAEAFECIVDSADHMLDIFEYKLALKHLHQAQKALEKSGAKVSAWEEGKGFLIQAKAFYLLHKKTQAKACAVKAKELYLKGSVSEEAYLAYGKERPLRLARIGECYMYMGEGQKALEMFEQMSCGMRCTQCCEPRCYEAFRDKGIYYHGIKQYGKALECYEKALEICPGDLELMLVIAKLRKEIKK